MRPEEFRKLVKDALEHLYDTAYLEVHPLLTQLSGIATANRSTRAQELRSILKNGVEELRPPDGLPSGSPAWRSYLVLRCRYIQGMTLGQVENELGLSRRQLQRETLKGLEALASMLWENHRAEADSAAPESALAVSVVELDSELDPLEIELNQWKFAPENCDVHALINDTLWVLKSTLEQHQADMQADLPAILPPVFVDATLTRQALFKILRTMIQNSRDNISLSAAPNDNFMVIRIGKPECAHTLEESDWRVAERIIHSQEGRLEFENNPTVGFQVIIRLPLASQTPILIIDDNQAILQLFERFLLPHHYEVRKAQGGTEALLMATESPPHLIILDVMMPTMDGWQVLHSLKQNPITENVPIIVCSVLKEPDLAISLGASAYLKKPVDRLELLTTLERILHP